MVMFVSEYINNNKRRKWVVMSWNYWNNTPKRTVYAEGVCVCVVITFSRLDVNRVWLPILLVVSWTRKTEFFLSPFAPESLVSRVRFGRPVPRQPAHSPHPGWRIWCLLNGLYPPFPVSATVTIITVMRHRASPEFIRSRNCVTDGVPYREPAQG